MNIIGVYGGFDWDANRYSDDGSTEYVHDSGATLFMDGKLITSIGEERLTRVKYEGNFPKKSIDYCLSEGNISGEDIDIVVVPSMCIPIFYDRWNKRTPQRILQEIFPNAKIELISHHQCHAASAVFTSDFNEGSFITLDGNGSIFYSSLWRPLGAESGSIGFFNKEKGIFRFIPQIHVQPNGFGINYLEWAQRIYIEKFPELINDPEKLDSLREAFCGKIMGLCAYGKDLDFSLEKYKIYATSLERLHNFPYIDYLPTNFITETFFNTLSPEHKAYVIQKNLEHAILDYFTMLKEETLLDDNVCLAGGVFLNVPMNTLLKESGLVKNMHIPPYTSDTGLHFGAAAYYSFKNKETIELPENIALLGKEYSEEEIEDALKEGEVNYEKYENFDEICSFTVNQIVDSKIIGWFQGKSEHGPRALGSRSLLMSPTIPDGKDIMNSRVKHREYWRPFAGIILDEDLTEYFEQDFCSPYMLYSLTVREDKRDEIPSITHEDNTCRIQTVNDTINPKVTKLLNKLKETCGSSVVLNTSFNDNGEPIVETPQDAVRSFKNMDIDYLVIGNFVVRK